MTAIKTDQDFQRDQDSVQEAITYKDRLSMNFSSKWTHVPMTSKNSIQQLNQKDFRNLTTILHPNCKQLTTNPIQLT